jgi:hypothetical protein
MRRGREWATYKDVVEVNTRFEESTKERRVVRSREQCFLRLLDLAQYLLSFYTPFVSTAWEGREKGRTKEPNPTVTRDHLLLQLGVGSLLQLQFQGSETALRGSPHVRREVLPRQQPFSLPQLALQL